MHFNQTEQDVGLIEIVKGILFFRLEEEDSLEKFPCVLLCLIKKRSV